MDAAESWKFLLPKQTKPINSGPVLPHNHLPAPSATFCLTHSSIYEFTWEDESEFPALLFQGIHQVFHRFIFVVQTALWPFQLLFALLVALDSCCPWVGTSAPPGEAKILHLISVNSIKTRPCSWKLPAELMRGEEQRKM